MNTRIKNHLRTVETIFAVLSLLMLTDFFLDETLLRKVQKNMRITESHHNASGNSHFSYMVFLEDMKFNISQDFAIVLSRGDSVEVDQSIIFREVNEVRFGDRAEVYSLRWASGFVLPILGLLIFASSALYRSVDERISAVVIFILTCNLLYLLY